MFLGKLWNTHNHGIRAQSGVYALTPTVALGFQRDIEQYAGRLATHIHTPRWGACPKALTQGVEKAGTPAEAELAP